MQRPTWKDVARGHEAAARVDAERLRALGPPSPGEGFAGAAAIWELFPDAFHAARSELELAEAERVRELWARLRRPHVR